MQKFRTKDRVYRREIARAQGATDHLGKPIFTPFTWNIVKGDLVQVTQPSLVRDPQSGRALQNKYGQTMAEKWNGQQGEVLKVIRKHEQVIVKGVNLTKRVVRVSTFSRERKCAPFNRFVATSLLEIRC